MDCAIHDVKEKTNVTKDIKDDKTHRVSAGIVRLEEL